VCGIAGFSLTEGHSRDPALLARLLLAGIAERGEDACGYAFPREDRVLISKVRGGASNLVRVLSLPGDALEALVHVREHTKGTPDLEANNHPIRHGSVIGIHNGRLINDDYVFAHHGLEREEPGMTVDSEALFALLDAYPGREGQSLAEVEGALAIAWLDERRPGVLHLARGWGRPLVVGVGSEGVFFASTRAALEMLAVHVGLELAIEEVPEGTIRLIAHGRVIEESRFAPRPGGVPEAAITPPSPAERERCLRVLLGPVIQPA
jgi:glutamine phosphoribosylpyrophosphate amidotransferase